MAAYPPSEGPPETQADPTQAAPSQTDPTRADPTGAAGADGAEPRRVAPQIAEDQIAAREGAATAGDPMAPNAADLWRRRARRFGPAAGALLIALGLFVLLSPTSPEAPSMERLGQGNDGAGPAADLEQLAFALRDRDLASPEASPDQPPGETLSAPPPAWRRGLESVLPGSRLPGSPLPEGTDPRRRVEAPEPPPGMPRLIPGRRPADDAAAPSQSIVRVEAPSAKAMWRRAEELHSAQRFHSLRRHLQRLLASYPDHAQARRWQRRLPRWTERQERNLSRDVDRRLEQLGRSASARDLDGIFALWAGSPDADTRRFFQNLVRRYDHLRVSARLDTVEVVDGVARFDASVVLRGRREGAGGETAIEQRIWSGALAGGHFASPFPG
ncbi:MAG: hypothetical protein AAGD06_22865 [Acidobacteriota bacterium]